MQVTQVFSADHCHCNLAEQPMHYHNHGCALAAIVSTMFDGRTSTETLAGVEEEKKMPVEGAKRKAHEQGMQGGY